MNIFYEKQAEKYLHKLTDDAQIRLETAINALPKGDVKALKGRPNEYRLRVGDYRVIFYKVSVDTIQILLIAPRGDAYKK